MSSELPHPIASPITEDGGHTDHSWTAGTLHKAKGFPGVAGFVVQGSFVPGSLSRLGVNRGTEDTRVECVIQEGGSIQGEERRGMDDMPLFVPHGGKPTRGKRTIGSFEVSRDLLIPDDVRAQSREHITTPFSAGVRQLTTMEFSFKPWLDILSA